MNRFAIVFILLSIIVSCEGASKNDLKVQDKMSMEELQPSPPDEPAKDSQPLQSESEPENESTPELKPTPTQDFPLDEFVQVPPNHYITEMEALSDSELKITTRNADGNEYFETYINMDNKEISTPVKIEDTPYVPEWEVVSPTGDWKAIWGWDNSGIRGVSVETDEIVQWTSGEGDWFPLWRSDGAGFYYLHATGVQMGDGAGPEHTLAYYDIVTGEQTVFSFYKGFWGSIRWLEPDRSLVVYNGFDDVFAVMVVHLEEGTENQILDTSDFEYVNVAVNPTEHRLLVSDKGHLIWYDSKGNEVSRFPWPDSLDEFTKKNASYTEDEDFYSSPYYEKSIGGGFVGPHYFLFSPDGLHLAYLLGAIGSHMDDKITGEKIVVSRGDGTEPDFVTEDYVRIQEYIWSPTSDRLFYVFYLDGISRQSYIGEIKLYTSIQHDLETRETEISQPDKPENNTVIEMIQSASSLYSMFAIDTLQTNNNCLTIPKYEYYCEMDSDGHNIQSYQDLRNIWGELYLFETVDEILSKHVSHYPESLNNYMLYEEQLYIVSGGRGASWGYENFWDRASAELVEVNDNDTFRVYQFILPNGQQDQRIVVDKNGVSTYELYYSSYGQHDLQIELVKVDNSWKLKTFIDTLGM